MIYFDSNYEKFSNFENLIETDYIALNSTCYHCQALFSFNNPLYKLIRVKVCLKNVFKRKNSNFDEIFVNTANIDEMLQIVRFKINYYKDIETNFEFRD